MRITNLELVNYRQYKNVDFTFKKTTEHDLHVLLAKNGIGKTNFLNSITWCLYDMEPHLGLNKSSLPILNDVVRNEMVKNDERKVEVTLTVKEGSTKLVFRRAMIVRKVENSDKNTELYNNPSDLSVCLYESVSSTPKLYKGRDAQDMVDKSFPGGIRDHFFFDNEHLSKFFKDSNSENVKSAIHQLSQIQYLSEIRRKMDIVINDYRSDAGKFSPKLDELYRKYMDLNAKFEEAENDVRESKDQLNSTNIELDKINSILSDAPNIKKFYAELEETKSRLKKAETRRGDSLSELNGFLREYLIKVSLYENAVKILNIISFQREKGEIPIGIDFEVLQESLDDAECKLCSSSLTPKLIEYIENEMSNRNLNSNKKGGFLENIERELKRLVDDVKAYPESKSKVWKNYEDVLEEIEHLTEKKEYLNRKISTRSDSEELKTLAEKRETLEELCKTLGDSIINLKVNVKTLSNEVDSAKKRYDDASAKHEKAKELSDLINLGDTVATFADEVKISLIDEIKNDIKDNTLRIFSDLVWKEKTYEAVNISENYEIDLIHKNGYSCLGSCSAAERSLLALAFTIAVHESSNSNAPLVIDSPVGRISDINRENFAKGLKDVSKNKQLIMIFTPSEYSEEVELHIGHVKSSFTRLVMNENENETFKEETHGC